MSGNRPSAWSGGADPPIPRLVGLSGLAATMRLMFMLHGRLAAKPGKRDELLAILTDQTADEPMPGCRLYVVSVDETDADGVWATEIWETAEAHQASLQIESVKQRIARAMPLIDVNGIRHQTLDARSGVPG
jgi:quinol monooxygenase YgiN